MELSTFAGITTFRHPFSAYIFLGEVRYRVGFPMKIPPVKLLPLRYSTSQQIRQ